MRPSFSALAFLVTFSGLTAVPQVAQADATCWDERGRCWYAVEGFVSCRCESGEEPNEEVRLNDHSEAAQLAACEMGLDLCGEEPPGEKSTCEEELRGACLVRHDEGTWRSRCTCADTTASDGGWQDEDGTPPATQEQVDAACLEQLSQCPKEEPGPPRIDCENEFGNCHMSNTGIGGCRCINSGWSDGSMGGDPPKLSEQQMHAKCQAYLDQCEEDAMGETGEGETDHAEGGEAGETGQATTGGEGPDNDGEMEDPNLGGSGSSDTGAMADAGMNDTGEAGETDGTNQEADAPGKGCHSAGALPLSSGLAWLMVFVGLSRRRRPN